MLSERKPQRRVGDLVVAGVYTVVLTVVLAIPAGNPDFKLPADPRVVVALIYGYTILGGLVVGLIVGGWWVLWSPAVMVVLSMPIVAINVIIRDPAPDGQGGMHILLLGCVAAAALACGVAVAQDRSAGSS